MKFIILLVLAIALSSVSAFENAHNTIDNIDGTGAGLVDAIIVERICDGYSQEFPDQIFVCIKNGNPRYFAYQKTYQRESKSVPAVVKMTKKNSTPLDLGNSVDFQIREANDKCENSKDDAKCIQDILEKQFKNYYVGVFVADYQSFVHAETRNLAPENFRKVTVFQKNIFVTFA